MSQKPRGGMAVMANRQDAPDSLDFFPTPPWATRALLEHVIPDASGAVWEPACGAGHMSEVLKERFVVVLQSDVHDYGVNQATGSFVGSGPDVIGRSRDVDWIITNPPFNLAVEFVERALIEASAGVAMLVRTSWMEGADRYNRLFRDTPPAIVAPFVERVPMVKGRWDPKASTATSYVWMVWHRHPVARHADPVATKWAAETRLVWIPPGCRDRLTKPDDAARFAGVADGGSGMFDQAQKEA